MRVAFGFEILIESLINLNNDPIEWYACVIFTKREYEVKFSLSRDSCYSSLSFSLSLSMSRHPFVGIVSIWPARTATRRTTAICPTFPQLHIPFPRLVEVNSRRFLGRKTRYLGYVLANAVSKNLTGHTIAINRPRSRTIAISREKRWNAAADATLKVRLAESRNSYLHPWCSSLA